MNTMSRTVAYLHHYPLETIEQEQEQCCEEHALGNYSSIWQEALETEKQLHATHHSFVHGQAKKWRLYQDLVGTLYENFDCPFDAKNFYFFRNPRDPIFHWLASRQQLISYDKIVKHFQMFYELCCAPLHNMGCGDIEAKAKLWSKQDAAIFAQVVFTLTLYVHYRWDTYVSCDFIAVVKKDVGGQEEIPLIDEEHFTLIKAAEGTAAAQISRVQNEEKDPDYPTLDEWWQHHFFFEKIFFNADMRLWLQENIHYDAKVLSHFLKIFYAEAVRKRPHLFPAELCTPYKIDDLDAADSKYILAFNPSIFSNHRCMTLFSPYFFMHAQSGGGKFKRETKQDLRDLLRSYGANESQLDTYVTQLLQIENILQKKEGQFFQLFFPKVASGSPPLFLVDRVTYPAYGGGLPHAVLKESSAALETFCTDMTQLPEYDTDEMLEFRCIVTVVVLLNPHSGLMIKRYTTESEEVNRLYDEALSFVGAGF